MQKCYSCYTVKKGLVITPFWAWFPPQLGLELWLKELWKKKAIHIFRIYMYLEYDVYNFEVKALEKSKLVQNFSLYSALIHNNISFRILPCFPVVQAEFTLSKSTDNKGLNERSHFSSPTSGVFVRPLPLLAVLWFLSLSLFVHYYILLSETFIKWEK